ncbi:MAG: hypothetical protein GY778_02265 [bacterium]|nr:hypothetical protein [bacterium]
MHRLKNRCYTDRMLTARSEHLTSDMSSDGVKDLGTWEYTYDARSNVLSAIQAGTIGATWPPAASTSTTTTTG